MHTQFGKGDDLSIVHNRCTNPEASYLPESVERYAGHAVLATNRR